MVSKKERRLVKIIDIGTLFMVIFLVLGCEKERTKTTSPAERSSSTPVERIEIKEFHPRVIRYLRENHPDIIKELEYTERSNQRPICRITSVDLEGPSITVEIMAYDDDGDIKSVQVRINSGIWEHASKMGADWWIAQIDIVPGQHMIIYARSFDGEDYSEISSTIVRVYCDTTGLTARSITLTGLIARDPITIIGNSEFTAENGVTGGSGTETDPYIIEGWEIDASLGASAGIHIQGTDAYFVIRNCRVYNGGTDKDGISWQDGVANGRIENCIIEGNRNGIFIDRSTSPNNCITQCLISKNEIGVGYFTCLNQLIQDCEIYDNTERGVFHSNGPEIPKYNKILNCKIYNNGQGIAFVMDGWFNTIEGCEITNNSTGIYFHCPGAPGAMYNEIRLCTISNNTTALSGGGFYNFYHHNNFANPGVISEGFVYFCFNWWSDYLGEDLDGDGIGEDPYYYTSTECDEFPLMDQVEITPLDVRSPDIGRVSIEEVAENSYEVTAILADEKGLQSVTLYYSVDGGPFEAVAMQTVTDPGINKWSPWKYSADMEFATTPEYVIYYIEAQDLSGNIKESEGMVIGDPPLILEASLTDTKLWPSQTNPASYTITIKNNSAVEDRITLSARIPPDAPSHTSKYWDIQLPSEVTIPPGSMVSVELTLSSAIGIYAIWNINLDITATSEVWRLSDSLAINTFVYPDTDFNDMVDIRDVGFVAIRFGKLEGDAGWDPYADVVPDGVIDIRDIAKTAIHFGRFRGDGKD